jgi:hypothetical protein
VNGRDISIALRLWLSAALLRPLKRLVPFETLVRLMHTRPGARHRSSAFERRLEHYMHRTGRFPFRPPSNCLERSLGAYRILCGANACPELVVGVRRVPGRGVEGHVWVTLDGRALAEHGSDLATYTAIARFDSSARRHTTGAPDAPLAGIPLE